MSVKLASISGVKFGTASETGYDVIITNIQEQNNSDETPLRDATGAIVATNLEGIHGELTCDFKIKGASHLGTQALLGSIINFDDAEFAGDYIVTGNSKTRQEGQWMSGTLTAKNYGSGFTTTSTTSGA